MARLIGGFDMKKWIHASQSLKNMDPFELKQAGYEIVDTGYARGKDEYEHIKQKLASRYPGVKVYRDRSDTPGLMMWSAYAPIQEEVNASSESTYYKGINRGPKFYGDIIRFKNMYYPGGYLDSYDGSPLEGECWTVGYDDDEEGYFWRGFTNENWDKIKDMSDEEIYNKFDVAPEVDPEDDLNASTSIQADSYTSLIPDQCKKYYKINKDIDPEEVEELTEDFDYNDNLEFIAPLAAKPRYEYLLSVGDIAYPCLCKDVNGKYGLYVQTSYGTINITDRVEEVLSKVKRDYY